MQERPDGQNCSLTSPRSCDNFSTTTPPPTNHPSPSLHLLIPMKTFDVDETSAYFYRELARAALGEVRVVREYYDQHGRKHIETIPEEYKSNPEDEGEETGQIQIGERFLSRPLRDYTNWRQAWWREALQNAIDAGANRIELSVTKNEDGSFQVVADDNGRGMTPEQVQSYFLRMGESGKEKLSGGSVGGFGKAKELLVLPWIEWQVHIDGWKFIGRGLPFKKIPGPARKGVRIEAKMPDAERTNIESAEAVLSRSYLPTIDVFLNGTLFDKAKHVVASSKIRTMEEKGNIFVKHTKGESHYTMLVRHQGLFMFEISIANIPAIVVFEMTGQSTELLASNRDGFRDYSTRWAIADFVNTLAKDPMSGLIPQGKKIRNIYRGEGTFQAENAKVRQAKVLMEVAETLVQDSLNEDAIGRIAEAIVEASEPQHQQESFPGSKEPVFHDSPKVALAPSRDLIQSVLEITPLEGASRRENAIKNMVWRPDFIIVNDNENEAPPKQFLPETMSPTGLRLAKVWVELCRIILMRMNIFQPFGVGFIFSSNTQAAFNEIDGTKWIMLNPFKGGSSKGEVFRSTDEGDLAELFACAIHECTHLDGYDYHDEVFANRFTRNVASCMPAWRDVKKVIAKIPLKTK